MYGKHIPRHNSLSPASLLITLTLTAFVAGATNQTDKQTQPEINFGPGACVYAPKFKGVVDCDFTFLTLVSV